MTDEERVRLLLALLLKERYGRAPARLSRFTSSKQLGEAA